MLMLCQRRYARGETRNQPSNHSKSQSAEVTSIWNHICHDGIRLQRLQSHKGESNHEEVLETNGSPFARNLKVDLKR